MAAAAERSKKRAPVRGKEGSEGGKMAGRAEGTLTGGKRREEQLRAGKEIFLRAKM